jgi:hypothetical protein
VARFTRLAFPNRGAFGAGKEIITNANKNAVPTIPPTTPSVIAFKDCIGVLRLSEHL